MTKAEYLQLVQSSESFKGMDQALQEKVLKAEGAEMEHYIVLFQEEQNLLQNAKTNLAQKDQEVVKNFKEEATQIASANLKKAEVASRADDEVNAENLLNNL